MERADESGDSVKMVAVKMSDENRMDTAALHAGSHELQLRAFAAVEQKHVAFADESGGRQSSTQRGHSGTGSEQYYFHRYLNMALKT